MPIEEQLSINNLNVISDMILKIQEKNQNAKNYYVNYRRTSDTKIVLSTTVQQTTDYNKFTSPYIYCAIQLKDNNNIDFTSENFNFTTAVNNCTMESSGSMDIPLTYNSSSNIYKYYASNMYNENYLDIEKYNTITQPNPSPEPEEPSTETKDYTNWFILLSAILMLIVMYRFISSLFSRGEK